MNAEVTTYVTYMEPGILYPEDYTCETPDRDAEKFAREAVASVFAFSFHDIARAAVTIDGQDVELSSRAIRKSPLYYIDAEQLTAADVEALPGDNSILLANMRGNRWETVVRCRTGNFRPLMPGDVVIRTTGDAPRA